MGAMGTGACDDVFRVDMATRVYTFPRVYVRECISYSVRDREHVCTARACYRRSKQLNLER